MSEWGKQRNGLQLDRSEDQQGRIWIKPNNTLAIASTIFEGFYIKYRSLNYGENFIRFLRNVYNPQVLISGVMLLLWEIQCI